MDLAGHKLARDGGRAVTALFGTAADEIAAGKAKPAAADLAAQLETALRELQAATMWLMQNGTANPDNAGAAACSYMELMDVAALGWALPVEAFQVRSTSIVTPAKAGVHGSLNAS